MKSMNSFSRPFVDGINDAIALVSKTFYFHLY